MKSRIPPVLFGILAGIQFVSISAATIHSPAMKLMTIGSEGAAFGWKEHPHIEGGYEGDGVFRLKGNGQGVYWCWDRCAAALLENPPLSGSFTFTARVKSMDIPGGGFGQVGIIVKGRPLMRHPVLSLRWDTYWEQHHGTGLTWFNRIAPIKDVVLGHSYSEKLCHGTGQGCIGMGYESSIDGYASRDDLWLRVKRVVEGTTSKFYLYARYGENAEWQEIPSITSTHNPCGATQTPLTEPLQLPNFMIPEDDQGEVSVGLFVAHGSDGQQMVTAEFDNITLEADNTDERHPEPLPNTFGDETVWWPSYMGPYGNFSTRDCEYGLVDYLEDARKVWESEMRIDGAKTGSSTSGASSGGASPIVADGKVFLWYQSPELRSGDNAPDIAFALDVIDGSTIWVDTLDMTYHDSDGKNFSFNHTPAYADGKLFVAGGGGALYCLSASDGERLWKASTPKAAGGSAVIVADGVVVLGMGGGRAGAVGDLGGYDTADGSQLWFYPNGCGGNGAPSKWVHKGKEYVIAPDPVAKIVRCIEPKTGDELWNIGAGVNEFSISVTEDYMFVNMGCRTTWTCDEADGTPYMACFKITPEKAELAWNAPERLSYAYPPVVYNERVYYIAKDGTIVAFDLHGGNIIEEKKIAADSRGSKFASNGRVAFERDGGHGTSDYYYFDIESDPLKLMLPYSWIPPHPTTTSYAVHMDEPVVDGRIFMRGRYALYCYDLRKSGSSTQRARPAAGKVFIDGNGAQRLVASGNGIRLYGLGASERGPVEIALYDYRGRLIHSRAIRKAPDGSYRMPITKDGAMRAAIVQAKQNGKTLAILRWVKP